MRHVRILSQPVGRLHDVAALFVTHDSGRLPEFGFRVLTFLRVQHVSVLVIRLPLVIDKEIDAGSKEVHSGCLEKLVASAATFLLALLQ